MKQSLRKQSIILTAAACVGLAVILSLVGYHTVFSSMARQEEQQMKSVVAQMRAMYDSAYPGEFGIRLLDDGSYIVYKGQVDMTDDTSVIDGIRDNFGYEATLFCRNIRVQTTLEDEDGKNLRNSKAAAKVDTEVLDGNSAKFYRSVTVGGDRSFAYYEPIVLENGDVYGMIGISRSARAVRMGAVRAVWPLVLASCLLAAVMGWISLRYTDGMIGAIAELQRFMQQAAKGDLQSDVPQRLQRREDELGSLAAEAGKMQRALRMLVEYDALTQLHNRRYGEKQLRALIGEDGGAPFCVALAEMDRFKQVNDTYGLGAGDGALRAVAKIFKQHMAGHGFAARWGGEEFLLVFEQTEEKDAYALMERMREALHACEIIYDKRSVRVTMSVGLVRGEAGETAEALLRRADERLHEAKSGGRDRICASPSVRREVE